MAADAKVYFDDPTGAARLSNGDIAISTGTRGGVRFVRPDGTMRRNIPFGLDDRTGRIHATSWMQACGRDSLFVLDHMVGVVTVLNSVGDAVRQLDLPKNWMSPTCNASGQLAVIARYDVPPPTEMAKTAVARVPILLLDRTGQLRTTLSGRAQFALTYVGGSWWRAPLGVATSVALGKDVLAVVNQELGSLEVVSLRGETIQRILLDTQSRGAVEHRHVRRAIAGQLTLEARNSLRARAQRSLGAVNSPAKLPALSSAVIDAQGVLWAVLSSPGDPSLRLRAFNSNGTPKAEVTIPYDLDVFEIGRDYILGRSTDAFGVAHVLQFRLHRR